MPMTADALSSHLAKDSITVCSLAESYQGKAGRFTPLTFRMHLSMHIEYILYHFIKAGVTCTSSGTPLKQALVESP